MPHDAHIIDDRISREALVRLLLANGIDLEENALLQREINGYFAGSSDPDISCSQYAEYAPADSIVVRALTGCLAVPQWESFCNDVREIYNDVKQNVTGGANATYIPILAEADPSMLGVAVCSVDGQSFQVGDWEGEFSIQSCVKPLMYAVAVDDNGVSTVHRRVGIEPSGLAFNEVSLNADGLPHNPMINSGAIASGSLILPDSDSATRFSYFMEQVSDMAGGLPIGFSQPTYLCEHETAWRNNALIYYMQDAQVFPPACNIEAVLDFYIQCCALEVNARVAANIASTMANGGISPLTKKKVLSPTTVKACLTLMFSCGMYDYSGEWCVNVGLPAKSGVAGLIYVVVPHVMGIAVWSPPLDERGNSVRGIEFFKRLLLRHQFGIFDQIVASADLKRHVGLQRRSMDAVAPAKRGRESKPLGRPDSIAPSSSSSAAAAAGQVQAVIAFEVHEHIRLALRQFGQLYKSFFRVAARAAVRAARPGGAEAALQALGHTVDAIDYAVAVDMLAHRGIDVSSSKTHPFAHAQLQAMVRGTERLRFVDLFSVPSSQNLVARALLDRLAIPVFGNFCAGLDELFHDARHDSGGEIHTFVQHLTGSEYGIAVCTVDGQLHKAGDSDAMFPLLSCVKPLLYAAALEDLSVTDVHEYVGNEPTSTDPSGFALMAGSPPKPFNPFMDSGALAVASVIGKGHGAASERLFADSGTRFTHIIGKLTAWAGGRKLNFDQPTFLAQQQYGLQLKAVAQFMKGMGCFTSHTDPEDVSKLYFQCCSIEMNCETLAVVAATFANMGRCPVTDSQCLDRNLMRHMLSVMYSCGMGQFAGKWNFSVGIPSRGSESGVLMLIIPNIMGIAIFSPRINEYSVSKRGLAICEALTSLFRVNLFDQLVYADEDLKVDTGAPDDADAQTQATVLFFDLCTAAGGNNAGRVRNLLERGADVSRPDYDRRTALHIACADGAVDVVPLLLDAGADPLMADRWGTTPLDDAVSSEHTAIVRIINERLM